MMTVSEMPRVMHENDLFDTFPECSKVVHILAVISVYIVFHRTIIESVAPIENLRL